MNAEIDPIHYGQLTAQVSQLRTDMEKMERTIDKMAGQIDVLMGLVNQGRGAFWVALIVGGAISSVGTFLINKLQLFSSIFPR